MSPKFMRESQQGMENVHFILSVELNEISSGENVDKDERRNNNKVGHKSRRKS